jgi:hypothetical protein
MSKKGLIHGGESTSHDSGNDILYTVEETGQQVLIEGDEYHLCKASLMNNDIHEYKNKTNKEILDDIYTRSSCMVKEGEANVGDFIICKLAVRDKTKRNLTGTIAEIVSIMQKEHGCRVVDGAEYEKMKKGGKVSAVSLAPNGKPSNLTPEQYRLVRTPEFKEWFGDWENDAENSSKVVDDNGEPLVVYRGFNSKSDAGNIFRFGINRFKSNRNANRFAHYFTRSKNVAKEYAEQGEKKNEKDIIVKSYFLKCENIADLTKSNPKYPTFNEWAFARESYMEFSLYQLLQRLKKREIPTYSYLFSSILSKAKNEDDINELSELKIKEVEKKIKSDEKELKRIYDTSEDVNLFHLVKMISSKELDEVLDQDYNLKDAEGKRKIFEWFINHKKSDIIVSEGLDLFLKQLLIENNFDGGKFNEFQFGVKNPIDKEVYFVFEPNQIKLADGTNTTFDGNNPDIRFKKGGYVRLSKTPAPKKERIYGSKNNPKGSSESGESAKSIKFSQSTLDAITNKVEEHNKKHPEKKITLDIAKAVVRRGMGAYSSTHRPTIKGGKPNSRVAWGLARLNAFIYKVVNGKSKSGRYSEDNDLLDELGIKHQRFANGGTIDKRYVAEADFYVNAKNDDQAKKEANEVAKLIDDKYDNKATVNHLYEIYGGIGNSRKVFKDGGSFQPPYPINASGGYDYKGEAKETAKKVDLLTLPKNVSGTHCGNCFFFQQGICSHKGIMLPVTDRMCCSVWDNSNSERSYEKNIENDKAQPKNDIQTFPKNKDGGYTYSGEALKIAEKFDLITLPKNIEGTNCANCSWYTPYKDGGFCFRSNILLPVTAKMSCAYWNSLSVKRDWGFFEQGGEINKNLSPIFNEILAEEDLEYKKGGAIKSKKQKVSTSSFKMPSRKIYEYAEKIRKNYPEIWDMGGNVFGNEAYKNLEKVIKRGYWKTEEEWMYKKWQSFMARHEGDFRIAGVIANLKWLNWVEKGREYSQSIINQEIKRLELNKMAHGGEISSNRFETFLKNDLANRMFGVDTFYRKFTYRNDVYRVDFLITTTNNEPDSANMLIFKEIEGGDDVLVLDLPFDFENFNFDLTEYYKMFGKPSKKMDKGGVLGISDYFFDFKYPSLLVPSSYFIPESIKKELANKRVPKQKYSFPFNYSLNDAEDVFKKIIGKDALRPAMNGIYLMGDFIAATDAHKLAFIGMSKSQYGAHWFGYPSPDKDDRWVKDVDKEEHGFYRILPESLDKGDYKHQGSISIPKLYQYITFLINNPTILNRTTYMVKMKYKNTSGEKDWIGVNAKYLKDVLDIYLKFGILNINIYIARSNRAILLSINRLDSDKNLIKQLKNNIFILLMPLMISDYYSSSDDNSDIRWAAEDLDFSTACGIYYDLSEDSTYNVLGQPDNMLSTSSILSESEFQLTADSFKKIFNNKKKQYGKNLLEIIYPLFISDFSLDKGINDKKYSEMSNKEVKLAVALAWANSFLY